MEPAAAGLLKSPKPLMKKQAVKRHHHKHNLRHRYEFLETLGRGAYGKVKKARDAAGRLVSSGLGAGGARDPDPARDGPRALQGTQGDGRGAVLGPFPGRGDAQRGVGWHEHSRRRRWGWGRARGPRGSQGLRGERRSLVGPRVLRGSADPPWVPGSWWGARIPRGSQGLRGERESRVGPRVLGGSVEHA